MDDTGTRAEHAPPLASGGLDLRAILHQRVSSGLTRSEWLARRITAVLAWLVRARRIEAFLDERAHWRDFEFIDEVFDHLQVSCRFRDRDIANIPASGRVVAIANHPLGGLDGLAILKMFGAVRSDVKVVVNSLLMHIEPLGGLLLPVDNMGKRTSRQQFAEIAQALERDEAVIIFPAGEVSRRGWRGVRDGKWRQSFLRFAQKTRSPLLPVHVKGRNSQLFYLASLLSMDLATLLLPRQLLNRRRKPIDLRVGDPIPIAHIEALPLATRRKIALLRRNIYRVGRGRKQVFKTEKTVIAPLGRQLLRQELKAAQMLGQTQDGKRVLLLAPEAGGAVMREIGRLREIAFRRVGEGTGKRVDLDEFDSRYRHIVVWDEDELEIAGAYRLGESWRWAGEAPGGRERDMGWLTARLYSATLFDYSAAAHEVLAQGIELGRSFVQPRYWGKRSLDYLWQGIGAYVAANPRLRYLYGPVSISGTHPQMAKDLIVWYYGHYFGDPERLARARLPYLPQTELIPPGLFCGTDRKADLEALRDQLAYMNLSLPTLIKQYSELTAPGGTRFCAFNIDPHFNYCVDGLIVVDIEQLKPAKRKRYVEGAARQRDAT